MKTTCPSALDGHVVKKGKDYCVNVDFKRYSKIRQTHSRSLSVSHQPKGAHKYRR